jgi:glycosyltransferase involved in cell wall biosynthesis
MKILTVITGLGVGGAERLLTNLADRFVACGHEVVLAYFHGELELAPTDARVRLAHLGVARHPLAVVAGVTRLRRLIREFRPDVVNSHLVHANILVRLLRLTTPMPRLVSSAHNRNEGGRLRMCAYRLTDRLADISTNVSQEAVQAFIDQGALRARRMVAIHNGIDSQVFGFDTEARRRLRGELGIDDATPMLLAVGRLREQKDYPNLLQALARLQQTERRILRLLIVGDGPERGRLGALAESLGLAPQVEFLGIRRDVADLMSACDVFVLSSAWEGFGLVVAEAMACERVVVATDSGGVREVVDEAGWLVPPRDPNALADAIARALDMGADASRVLGRHARERVVERYSMTVTAARYLAVYRGEVSGHSPRRYCQRD